MQITPVVAASSTLTLTDNFDDTETATIAGKVYTMRTTLGASDGSVQLASGGEDGPADAAVTLNRLADAINLDNAFAGEAAGVSYPAAMTQNAHVVATRPSALVLKVTAKVPGTVGNFITVAETHGEGAWAAGTAVLTGGTGSISAAIAEILAGAQLNAEVIQALKSIDGDPASR